MNIKSYLTFVFLFLCISAEVFAFDDSNCGLSETWSEVQNQQDDLKQSKNNIVKMPSLKLILDSNNIKLGQPFSFNVELCNNNKEQVVSKPDRITADAIMPAHQHGMNYIPKINFNDATKGYEVSGFLFHMPGEWEITISSYYADKATHYTKLITIN